MLSPPKAREASGGTDEFNPFQALKNPPGNKLQDADPGPVKPDPAYEQWRRNPTPTNLRNVINQHQKTIDAALRTYTGGTQAPLLRKRAEILAARAVKNYDPTRGARLSTYLSSQLQQMAREVPAINDPMPKPERLRRESAQLWAAEQQLTDQLNRPPTDEELADQLNYDVNKVRRTRRRDRASISEGSLISRDEETDEEDGDWMPGTERQDPINTWAAYVYHELDPRDKLIFQYRTGWGGAKVLSNREIARKLNVSEATVSKRAGAIEKRINEFANEMETP